MSGIRGEYRKSAERRQQIVEAAFAVFSRTGFTAASLNEIAREVGMSHTGLVHHFRTKVDLMRAVLEQRDIIAEDILAGRRGLDSLRGLMQISQLQVHQRGVVQVYAVLGAEAASPEHPAHEYFRERYARINAFTVVAYEETRAAGYLRAGVDPRYAALSTMAIQEGVERLWLSGLDVDIVEDVRQHIQQFLTVAL